MTDNLSPEPLVGDAQLTSSNGGGTVSSPALSLADLNATLGSTFKDTDTALRALKDTQSFVGKRKEDIANEVRSSIAPSNVASKDDIQALKSDLFYSQNPQYKPYQNMLNKLDADPSQAANMPEFKDVFERAQKADAIDNSRSVVSSNSRLSEQKSVMDQAVQVSNARGSTNEDTALVFARAINADNNQ